ncbi:MAG TPA: zinc ribbon domain-containing protein [Pyrinomonadaceae bacterium]|jgi:hypothetical protein|nr:zinc ribbon domain-containing protein [Pyrinomonadaceae bacterium]
MENKCHKCGAPVKTGEPFCGRCGAVVGMRDAAAKPDQSSPDFAATVVGKQPAKRRPTSPAITKERTVPADLAAATRPRPEAGKGGGGSSARYAVIGFVAVLLVGGLLLLLLWLNSGG